MEIERKWLIDPKRVNELKKRSFAHEKVEQYYLNDQNDAWVIRLKKAGSDCFITLKSKGLLSREELELHISKKDFADFIKHAKTSIKKTRYIIELSTEILCCLEMDVYDDYEFVTGEVEFDSEEEANNFVAPDFCVEDVTMDPKYKNVNLAK